MKKCNHCDNFKSIGIKCNECFLEYGASEMEEKDDQVNSPPHYQSKTGLEVINIIEAFELNFNLGNAIKYILRSDKKGNLKQDLQKAIWYLNREGRINE